MIVLTGTGRAAALPFMNEALALAKQSGCHRAQCGAVIVAGGEIIGRGWNAPPQDRLLNACFKDRLPAGFKSDKTCCVHAEQRAVLQAMAQDAARVPGSTLFFARIEGGAPYTANVPYCTICSKLQLDAGVAAFVMWVGEELHSFPADEMNWRSFGFDADPSL